MTEAAWSVIRQVAGELDEAGIAYVLTGDSALFAQGVELDLREIQFDIQWDLFPKAEEIFAGDGAGDVTRTTRRAWFSFEREGLRVEIHCRFNTVVAADPERIAAEHDGFRIYAKHWQHYRRALPKSDPRQERINLHTRRKQIEMSAHNGKAWTKDSYRAWVARYGEPSVAVERLRKDPALRLSPLDKHIGDVNGRKVINLLGSHGSKAVAMALLGADATVIDISQQNADYALELAAAAGVPLRYVVSDVLQVPDDERTGDYDLVLMEGGILHYFLDLLPLTKLIGDLLAPGGRLILNDFHPISTKLITSKGKKHKVTGNYFDMGLQSGDVAYAQLLTDEQAKELGTVVVRRWTLGEIVTAVADSGLFVSLLEETPNTKSDDFGLPKMYTLIAEKRPHFPVN